jgi:hypothetical protein
MSIIDPRDAYWRFRMASGLPYNQNTRRAFLRFLGIEEDSYLNAGTDRYISKDGAEAKLPEDARYKLEWLGGPHYKALYAVWRARNGEGY